MSSCCGEKRSQWSIPAGARSGDGEGHRPRIDTSTPAPFEYTGKTALTVTGPYSGKTYRFISQGARLEIDGRDALALSGIPVLKRIATL